jgi:hypothetical protein
MRSARAIIRRSVARLVSLLGATPKLIAEGLPDGAFTPLTGDDRTLVSKLKRRNTKERAETTSLLPFETSGVAEVGARLREVTEMPEKDLANVHQKEADWRATDESPELARRRLAANLWCAAFVWPRHDGAPPAPTTADLRRVADQGAAALSNDQLRELDRLSERYQFFSWPLEFPEVLPSGFSAVVGNPPWERIKLQEQEFFAGRDPDIAEAPNAAARKRLIAQLEATRPALWRELQSALRQADGESLLVRASGRFLLTGRGDINTYSVFAETCRSLLAPTGRLGIIVPTGIATDATTAPFFRSLVETGTLATLLDFENEAKIFADVHHAYRFAVLAATGGAFVEQASFAFSTRHLPELAERMFRLRPREILLVNPNTGTCPVFRSRRDAEITLDIHRTAVGHKFQLAFPVRGDPACLQAALSSLVVDYCTRQKVSGAGLPYFVMKQLPVLPPEAYRRPTPWAPEQELVNWVAERVLELSHTSWDTQVSHFW